MNENENEEIIECYHCGDEISISDSYELPSGDRICQECRDYDYAACDDCGELVLSDDMTHIENTDTYICDDCLEHTNYVYCNDCEEYYDDTRENMTLITSLHGGSDYYVCEDCLSNHGYTYCNECDRWFYDDDISYCEEDDEYYCDECYEGRMRELNSDNLVVCGYHDHKGMYEDNILSLENEDLESVITYGSETEIENKDFSSNNRGELLKALSENGLKPVFERDGSLDCTGVEMITMPFTYDYLMSKVEDIKNAFTKAIDLGYRSDRSHCSVHIHVKRPSDEVIDRIWLIMETFKSEIIQVARRHNEGYAHFISDEHCIDENTLKSLYYLKDNKNTSDRYYALNLTNRGTIEFRIFKGTLNYRTWLAYHQFIHNIMIECSNLDKNVEDIKWEDLIVGEYISELVEKRNIVSYTRVIDNTKRLEELENKKKEMMENVNKIFKKYSRQLLNGLKIDKSAFENTNDLRIRLEEFINADCYYTKDIVNDMANLEFNDRTITLEKYIEKVKSFVNRNVNYAEKYRMSEELKNAILDIVSGNEEDMGGEE